MTRPVEGSDGPSSRVGPSGCARSGGFPSKSGQVDGTEHPEFGVSHLTEGGGGHLFGSDTRGYESWQGTLKGEEPPVAAGFSWPHRPNVTVGLEVDQAKSTHLVDQPQAEVRISPLLLCTSGHHGVDGPIGLFQDLLGEAEEYAILDYQVASGPECIHQSGEDVLAGRQVLEDGPGVDQVECFTGKFVGFEVELADLRMSGDLGMESDVYVQGKYRTRGADRVCHPYGDGSVPGSRFEYVVAWSYASPEQGLERVGIEGLGELVESNPFDLQFIVRGPVAIVCHGGQGIG